MLGHAAANMLPVIASNRIGTETFKASKITFYGSSFIADHTGDILKQCDRTTPGVLTADLDLDAIHKQRIAWGLFRDRRPDLYTTLLTKDGITKPPGAP